MRADRAYIAGLGTTGVLVGSALLLLAVVSTLVAFRGWPGTDVAEDIGNLVVGDSERPLAVQDGPARVAREAAPAAGAVAETAAPGTAAAASAPAARTTAGSSRTRPRTIVPPRERVVFRDDGRLEQQGSTTEPNPLSDRAGPGSLLPQTPVSAEVQRVTSGLGDATQGLTDGLGQTVGQLSPPLGDTLTDTGRLLADLLRALGQAPR
jgi:hypothetical protein